MQFVVKAKHDFASVTHVDGTARVQIVRKDSTSALRPILEEYYEKTGIPMILNTSLNVKGEPMVNTIEDADRFSKNYGVRVF
jgi:carbamoyltransferase